MYKILILDGVESFSRGYVFSWQKTGKKIKPVRKKKHGKLEQKTGKKLKQVWKKKRRKNFQLRPELIFCTPKQVIR